jgi:hypothetical protein
MFGLGTIVAELFLAPTLKVAINRQALAGDYAQQQLILGRIYRENLGSIPANFRYLVDALLQIDPKRRPSALDLLQTVIPNRITRFPDAFPFIRDFFNRYYRAEADQVIEVFRHALPSLLGCDHESLELVVTIYTALYKRNIYLLETLEIFDKIAAAIGPQMTRKFLLKPLTELYDSNSDPEVQLKLYSSQMLGRLWERFGLHDFLEYFIDYVLRATASSDGRIAHVAAQSTLWLIRRCGAGITARFLLVPLLRLLNKPNADFTLVALKAIVENYGPQVITQKYLPHTISLVGHGAGLLWSDGLRRPGRFGGAPIYISFQGDLHALILDDRWPNARRM